MTGERQRIRCPSPRGTDWQSVHLRLSYSAVEPARSAAFRRFFERFAAPKPPKGGTTNTSEAVVLLTGGPATPEANQFRPFSKLARLLTLLGICLVALCGCQKTGDSAHKKQDPAKVAQPGDEQALNTITLTDKAKERLGIRLVEMAPVDRQRRRTFGGEVVVPSGQTIIVSAPITGTLSVPESGQVPSPGSNLTAGQEVLKFTPMLTPEREVLTPAERVRVAQSKADIATAQIEAERQVEATKVQVEAAKIAYDRAVQLLEDKAGSQRTVDEADAKLRLAREAQITAEARYKLLSGISLDEDAGELMPRTITAPVSGILQVIDVAPGETVAAGKALFHVVRLDRVWIRVPVYVGHRRDIDTEQDASIAEYGQRPDAPTRTAKYVSAPPSADPAATTVDLFYELANDDGRLYPGQKVPVTLTMQSQTQSLVVHSSAILYDIHGGAWVYEEIAPLTYVRRRVQVEYTENENAVLAAGPEPGAKIVTDGAAELFGTEFGVGK